MDRLKELKVEIVSFLRDHLGANFPDFSSLGTESSIYNNEAFKQIDFEVIPPTEYLNNHVSVRVGCHVLKIQSEAINTVVGVLESYVYKDLVKLHNVVLNPRDKTIELIGYMPLVEIPKEGEYYDDGALGVNYIKVDSRFEGLTKFIYAEFEHISLWLRNAATLYCADGDKVKTDDIVLRLNTHKPGKGTEFFFTVTRVPHTFNPNEPIPPVMTPMTEEDKCALLGYVIDSDESFTYLEKIDAAMDRINAQVKTFINCEEANKFKSCDEQVVEYVNTVLIPTIVTIQLQPYSTFGGTYEQLMREDGKTLNAEACLTVIDTVLGDLWKMLDDIESANDNFDIKYFAIDTDSFGVYGMNEQDKPIHTVVAGPYTFRNAIERHHTSSFIEVFKRYLKTVKNKRVFTHKGEIDPTTIRSTADRETFNDVNLSSAETTGDKAVFGNSLKDTIEVIKKPDDETPAE